MLGNITAVTQHHISSSGTEVWETSSRKPLGWRDVVLPRGMIVTM